MKRWSTLFLSTLYLTGAIFPMLALSQTLTSASTTNLQAQIGRDAEGFSSCGIRVNAVTSDGDKLNAYDFSLVVYRGRFQGVVKAGKYISSAKEALAGRFPKSAALPAAKLFWIAQETDSKPFMPIKYIPAEDKGFILGIGDLVDAWKAILAISNGEKMQFSLRYPTERYDHVVGFSSQLPTNELTSLTACLDSLYAKLEENISDKASK